MRVGSLFSGYGGLDMAVERYFGATTRNLAGIVTGNTPEWEGGST